MEPAKTIEVRPAIEALWQKIRNARLYAGQPRNRESGEAVARALEALALAEASEDSGLIAEAWRMVAYARTANEDYREAVACYERTIAQYESRGEQIPARQLIGYIAALSHAGMHDKGLDIARQAEARLKASNDDAGFARLCVNVANLYHRLDQHQKSYDYYVTAAETFRNAGDRQAEAQVYLNLGNTLSQINRFEESDQMYQKSEDISRALALDELWAQAFYNRAYLHYLRGRYSDALHGFARMRQRFLAAGSARHHALCDLDETEIYLQLNLSKDASTLSSRAIEQFGQLGMTYEKAKAQAFHGAALTQMRRFSEALEVFKTAQLAFEAEGNEYWDAVLDLHRADVYLSLERYWEAAALSQRARDKFDALAIPSRRLASRMLLGRLAFATGEIARARQYVDEMQGIVDEATTPLLLFPCYMLSAGIAERHGSVAEALRYFTLAAEDLETHQSRLQHDDLRVTFLEGRHKVYEALVRLSFDGSAAATASAYAWCERAKSRGLVELLSHHLPSIQGPVDQTLLGRIGRLREELNVHYLRSQPERQSGFSKQESESVAIKEQELAQSLREVASSNPEFVSLHQVSFVGMPDVQTFLPEDTEIVEYFFTEDEVLGFLISRDEAIPFRQLAPPGRVHRLQERLAFQLEKFMLGSAYVRDHSRQILEVTNHYLRSLYDVLIAPMISSIRARRLIIIPHGTLHRLPFHALFDGTDYLMDRFEITYAPSASVLRYCMEKPDIADAAGVIVGVPDENAPLVEQEVRQLRAEFPDARLLEGEAATREAFRLSAQRAAFVHVASHVAFRHDNPMFSSLKLSDGYLTAMDLFSITCQTNLVTLSGCSSGRGMEAGSDDQLGLMRAFLYAGARSMVLSLWNVSDESTTELMSHLYKELRSGTPRSLALNRAMRHVRATWPDPFYWAPFTLAGKP